MVGAITGYIDVAQVTLYVFWAFFAGLIFYLRREDKREGYPLVSDRSPHVSVEGFPSMPTPKTFLLASGEKVTVPRKDAPETIAARTTESFQGAPLTPLGNPLIDGVGPAAYSQRADRPDRTFGGNRLRIIPLRADPEYFLTDEDPDPRGMAVFGADDVQAGVVTDAWFDRSEAVIRYLEVAVGSRSVLVPMTMLQISRSARRIDVVAITAAQFADVPLRRSPDEVTLLEEDKIMGYFGGGTLYATPGRSEPLL